MFPRKEKYSATRKSNDYFVNLRCSCMIWIWFHYMYFVYLYIFSFLIGSCFEVVDDNYLILWVMKTKTFNRVNDSAYNTCVRIEGTKFCYWWLDFSYLQVSIKFLSILIRFRRNESCITMDFDCVNEPFLWPLLSDWMRLPYYQQVLLFVHKFAEPWWRKHSLLFSSKSQDRCWIWQNITQHQVNSKLNSVSYVIVYNPRLSTSMKDEWSTTSGCFLRKQNFVL